MGTRDYFRQQYHLREKCIEVRAKCYQQYHLRAKCINSTMPEVCTKVGAKCIKDPCTTIGPTEGHYFFSADRRSQHTSLEQQQQKHEYFPPYHPHRLS
jgi:hypothetical protein